MSKLGRLTAVAVLLAALLLAAAACGDDTSAEDAKAQLITDLQAFDASVEKVRSLTAASSVDEAQAARDEAQAAWEKVVESAKDVEDAQVDNVQTAWDDFSKAVDDLPSDASIGEAAMALKPQIDAVKAAYDDLYNGLQ